MIPKVKPYSRTKPVRIRSKPHLDYVRSKPCLNCKSTQNIEAHHLLRVPDEPHGMGLKTGDNWTIPLCASCHRKVHAAGSEEKAFGKGNAETALDVAAWLWKETEPSWAASELTRISQEMEGNQ